MPSSFDIIADKVRTQLAQAGPDTPSWRILSLLNELLAALQLEDRGVDDLAIASLKAHILKLDGTINWQADILQAVKTALEAGDSVTMTQLPMHAKAILDWAKGITPPP